MYYIAYGSNLNIKDMKDRCPFSKIVGTATLKNSSLVFKGSCDEYSYLTLEDGDNDIPLGIFEISENDERVLDIYEGYPELYEKRFIKIDLDDKPVEALIYIMKQKYDYYLPSIEYIERVLEGYNDFAFDQKIIFNSLNRQLGKNPEKRSELKNKILSLVNKQSI